MHWSRMDQGIRDWQFQSEKTRTGKGIRDWQSASEEEIVQTEVGEFGKWDQQSTSPTTQKLGKVIERCSPLLVGGL